ANCLATWRWGPAINSFPFFFEEAGETPQCLAHVHQNILSFTGGFFPKRGERAASCGQTDGSHAPEPDRTWKNRVFSVKTKLSAGISGRHADVPEDVVDTLVQVEVRRRRWLNQLSFQRFSQSIG